MNEQSKLMSLAEAVTNTVVGLFLAFMVNAALMHWTGVTASAMQNLLIVGGHTVVSVVRSYMLRRLFNAGWRPRLQAWWICKRPAVVEFFDRAACWYGRSGRGAPILHAPTWCGSKECRCMKQDVLRAKFDEESA
jgi:hypothetical protein